MGGRKGGLAKVKGEVCPEKRPEIDEGVDVMDGHTARDASDKMPEDQLRLSFREFRYDSDMLKEFLMRMDAVQMIMFGKWLELTASDITLQAQLAEYDRTGLIYDRGLGHFREPTKVERGESPVDYEFQKAGDKSIRPKILNAAQIMEKLLGCTPTLIATKTGSA